MPDTLEAEVLEIDGSPPVSPREPQPQAGRGGQAWESMRGKALRLDRRWWPLWVVLGIVIVVVMMTVGLAVAAVVVVAKIIGSFLRLLTGGGSIQTGSSLSR